MLAVGLPRAYERNFEMRNFARINNYYNRLEAVNDWLIISRQAIAAGMGDLAVKHAPPEGAGWRKIDKCIAALRADIQATQHPLHPDVAVCPVCKLELSKDLICPKCFGQYAATQVS